MKNFYTPTLISRLRIFQKFLSKNLLTISVALIVISIYPWSIKEFVTNDFSQSFRLIHEISQKNVITNEVQNLSKVIKNTADKTGNILFISADGSGEKEFFMLSYELYPTKLFWISNPDPGPINWWKKNDLSDKAIQQFIKENSIKMFVFYSYPYNWFDKELNNIYSDNIFKLIKI